MRRTPPGEPPLPPAAELPPVGTVPPAPGLPPSAALPPPPAAVDVIPSAKAQNMGIIIGSPLQQGALSRRYDEVVKNPPYWLSKPRVQQFRKLYALLDECGLPLPELGIRFVLSNPDIHCVLMGAKSAAEVEQNAAAANAGPLPADILRRLDGIAALVPFRPFGEPFGIGWLLGNPAGYKGQGQA